MKVTTRTGSRIKKMLHIKKPPTIHLGFFSTATYPDGQRVPDVARLLNYGGRVGKFFIPPRPFLTTLASYKGGQWRGTMHELYKQHLPHIYQPSTFDIIYNKFAILVSNDLKDTMILWRTPPNSPYTIAKKGSSNPLIDTKHMVNSATYKLVY